MADPDPPLRAVPSPEPFGPLLKRHRRADGLTQAELGDRIGAAQQTIGAWERGERPQPRYFPKLAEYLSLDERELASLIGEAGDDSADSNDETMRQLAQSFIESQRTGPLPPPQAADIYRNLTDYFRARAVGK